MMGWMEIRKFMTVLGESIPMYISQKKINIVNHSDCVYIVCEVW